MKIEIEIKDKDVYKEFLEAHDSRSTINMCEYLGRLAYKELQKKLRK